MVGRSEVNRDPEIALMIAKNKIARHDADDGVLRSVQHDGLVDARRIAHVAALPEAVADDDDLRAGAVFIFGESVRPLAESRRGRRKSSE